MANTVTVWVRLTSDNRAAMDIANQQSGALPLVMRMRSSDGTADEDFVFPYSPREMSIGQLSDEMTQIARPATTPIVAFKAHRLMTLEFTAVIAYPQDGLIKDVEQEIMVLRRFASSSNKVFELKNYDIFTNTPFKFRNMSEEKNNGLFFSFMDMSIDVQRRNQLNKITQASVKISLVENRNPNINIAYIPPLSVKIEDKKCTGAKYRKSHPNKCKKAVDVKRAPSSSSGFDQTAKANLDSTKNCVWSYGVLICG